MQPQPAVHDGLPGINARTVGAVVIRLETPACQQLHVRDQEVQLQPPLIHGAQPTARCTGLYRVRASGTRSKLAISFSRCPGGKSFSAKDRTPDVLFCVGRGV
ncbi:hypothetical protein AB2F93_25015, partial (plasmid) [Escherichia coli]